MLPRWFLFLSFNGAFLVSEFGAIAPTPGWRCWCRSRAASPHRCLRFGEIRCRSAQRETDHPTLRIIHYEPGVSPFLCFSRITESTVYQKAHLARRRPKASICSSLRTHEATDSNGWKLRTPYEPWKKIFQNRPQRGANQIPKSYPSKVST